jgi:hypothetical protein
MTAKTQELHEKEIKLAAAKLHRVLLIAVRDELQRMLDLIPRRRNMHQHREFFGLTKALTYIDIGLTRNEGVPFDVMAPLLGKPGLLRTDETIEDLEIDCEELREHVKKWPTPSTKNKFKFIGRPDKHHRDGRYLEPGDVVSLSESAATALADLFEAV